MMKPLIAAIALLATVGAAEAGPVVFRGGAHIASTSGCTVWNPVKNYFFATFQRPVAGSSNGPDSTITLGWGQLNVNAFTIRDGVFTSTYKPAALTITDGRVMTGTVLVKINSQIPATITAATQSVLLTGSIKGVNTPDCILNFRMHVLKDLGL